MNSPARICTWVLVLLLSPLAQAAADQNWMVHEWGTFTSLQDETGKAIGGINTDDEPVPQFVHRLANFLFLHPSEVPGIFFQGAPQCHPDVTMRLETPVLYFHPPAAQTNSVRADVRVQFHGGWLTEFYPDAAPDAPGLKEDRFRFGPLDSKTTGSLMWSNLQIGAGGTPIGTSAHVWTSPRAVQAAQVQTTNGESEKFLFYRGVAHLDAPLKISRDTNAGQLVIRSQLKIQMYKPLEVPALWLVDVKPGGKIAFRPLPALTLQSDSQAVLTQTSASFQSEEYSADNLPKLKTALLGALIKEGLFEDEGHALLNTWELSYFRSTGLRLFFIVPRAWTDFHMPLDISIPADINRVMVGRIELVSPEQRNDLKKIAGYTIAEINRGRNKLHKDYYASLNNPVVAFVDAGSKPLSDLIPVPDAYQTYLNLGRFRNALVLEASHRHETDGLTNFIESYGLQGYQPLTNASKPMN